MKKSALKRVITGMVLLIAISLSVGTVYAAEGGTACEVSPRYSKITAFTFTPNIEGHYASCSAKVSTKSSYTAEVVVEIQRQDGGWYTDNRWSDRYNAFAAVNAVQHYIRSNYTYRFKVTANIYDSNGELLESDVRYSSNMSC